MNLDGLKSNLELICGINPVYSLLKTNAGKRKIYEIYLSKSRESNQKVKEILNLAEEKFLKFSIIEASCVPLIPASPSFVYCTPSSILVVSDTGIVAPIFHSFNSTSLGGGVAKVSSK